MSSWLSSVFGADGPADVAFVFVVPDTLRSGAFRLQYGSLPWIPFSSNQISG